MEDQLSKWVIDVHNSNVRSVEVLAASEEDARERYLDGVVVHSEVSGDEIVSVAQVRS